MCYISMDSYQQVPQTNGNIFPNFNFVFKLLTEKYSNGVNIDRSAMYYIYQWIRLNELYKPMESFFKFRNHFSN